MRESVVNQPVSEVTAEGAVEITARPNCSASAPAMTSVVVVLGTSVLGVSMLGYSFGNVFAPLFAVLDMLFVSFCFYVVWRRGRDHDQIRIGASDVRIIRHRGDQVESTSYPTAWVRMWRENADPAPAVLYMGAYGRRIEVGSFLAGAQRASLEALIKTRLGEARSPSRTERIENVARGQTA